eukprot:m.264617 g.264617  ORF g.264617 m.264617 type:complete len:168 (-) comp15619_c0_seq1:173-676(-)
MSDDSLLLDPAIRNWVVVPIVLITFFVGLCKHYVQVLITNPPTPERKSVLEQQILNRAKLLRANGKYITSQGFYGRKHYFNDMKNGVLQSKIKEYEDATPTSPMQDPNQMMNMMKGSLINYIPMMVVGGLIGWAFSGFVISTLSCFPFTTPLCSMPLTAVACCVSSP